MEINLVAQISQPKDKDLKTMLFQKALCYNAGASPRSVTVTTDIVFCSMQSQVIDIWQNSFFFTNNSHSKLIINDFNILLKDNENKTFVSWPCCVF